MRDGYAVLVAVVWTWQHGGLTYYFMAIPLAHCYVVMLQMSCRLPTYGSSSGSFSTGPSGQHLWALLLQAQDPAKAAVSHRLQESVRQVAFITASIYAMGETITTIYLQSTRLQPICCQREHDSEIKSCLKSELQWPGKVTCSVGALQDLSGLQEVVLWKF
jgi:hypothetical protein